MKDFRTDLAAELVDRQKGSLRGIKSEKIQGKYGTKIHRVEILSEDGARKLGKPKGSYYTVDIDELDSSTFTYRREAALDIAEEFSRVVHKKSYDTVLVAGLGNRDMTADSLGPYVCERIFVTRHIKASLPGMLDEKTADVAVIAPGVFGVTGIESEEVVTSLAKRIDADMVVLIDSLASGDPIRIGRSVQITDTGIIPGSGIGNRRVPLNKDTLGIDVIAIGMPMVTYASNIIRSATDKQMDASYEDMVVTPKNIDEIVEKSAETIAFAIDYALNPHIKRDLIDLLHM